MDILEIIFLIVMLLLSAISFVISYRQFKETGLLINNSYLYASREEREKMNKKPHYRQSAIVFCLIGIIFLLIGMSVFTGWKEMLYSALAVSLVMIIYAVISSINIERKR